MAAELTRQEILKHALEIADAYQRQGLTLTLRQLYYRFVALGLTDSGQNVYSRIGSTLTDARYGGAFPIDWIEDRGRDVGTGDFTRTVYGPSDPVVRQLTYSVNDVVEDIKSINQALPSYLA